MADKLNLDDYDYDGCKEMAIAAVKYSIIEYAKALVKIKKKPKDYKSRSEIEINERFFRSDKFALFCDIVPEFLIKKINEDPEKYARKSRT